jgi:dsDNA-binding SOS-regulon protein
MQFQPFIWIEEVDEVFQELKRYLTSPPVMVAPEPGEPLLLYIMATTEVVSMVLVAERSEPQQTQVPKGASASSSISLDPPPPRRS